MCQSEDLIFFKLDRGVTLLGSMLLVSSHQSVVVLGILLD